MAYTFICVCIALQVVYYKRRHGTTFAFFDLYSNTYDWSSTYNTLGNEFNLYSSLDDAIAGTNAWTYCNYDDPGVCVLIYVLCRFIYLDDWH